MYGSLSTLANVTSNGVCVYLKLFSVTDANQRRLVRSKMSTIFKPNVRRALNLNTSDSSQGIFGGVSNVLKNLEESKKINMLVKSSLLQTKKSGQAGSNSGKNKGKKPVARGSKSKNKKGSTKKSGKEKAKKTSGDTNENEDSAKEKDNNDQCKLVTQELLHPVILPVLGRVGVGPVWIILYLLFPGVLIGQLVFCYSLLHCMCQPWVFIWKPSFPGYL